jgi:homocysteine S-methyltransferase
LAAYANRGASRRLRVFPHLTTRDRNLIALQADLLGAHVNGVNDILVITGDPPKLGSNKDATAVYDIDSIGLTYLIDCLNRGVSTVGDRLGKATDFGIGVAANPTAINLDLEVQRWRYKHESGADFAVTQPIFDPESLLRWRDRVGDAWRPHMVGIWPLLSLRNAEFLANEVPGVKVPVEILEEMAKAGSDAVEAARRGVEIAHRIMRRLDDACEGFCISAPLNKVDIALDLLKRNS